MTKWLKREELLKNGGGTWRPIVVALGGGPLGFLFWSWLHPHRKRRALAWFLTALWSIQFGLSIWLIPEDKIPRWHLGYTYFFTNGWGLTWLMGALLFSPQSPGGKKLYAAIFGVHFLAMESWLPLLSRLFEPGAVSALWAWTLPLTLGIGWSYSLIVAIQIPPQQSTQKPWLGPTVGSLIALTSLSISILLALLHSTLYPGR